MNPTSQVILNLVENTPGYSMKKLCEDLGLKKDGEVKWLTTQEVCVLLSISRACIDKWVKNNKLKPDYFGSRRVRRFRYSDILNLRSTKEE